MDGFLKKHFKITFSFSHHNNIFYNIFPLFSLSSPYIRDAIFYKHILILFYFYLFFFDSVHTVCESLYMFDKIIKRILPYLSAKEFCCAVWLVLFLFLWISILLFMHTRTYIWNGCEWSKFFFGDQFGLEFH